MPDHPYHIDLNAIHMAFPPGMETPPLLVDFAEWLKEREWGSVACFDLVGQFSDSAPIVDGSPLRKDFALFIRMPDGSAVGYWFGPGLDPSRAPIVALGSEGQHEILSPSLEGLLARVALQQFEDGWSDFLPHEDVQDDASDELADWLVHRLGAKDLDALTEPSVKLPNFRSWMDKWCRDREDHWARHPIMMELGRQLMAHLPSGKNPWDRTRFEVAIAGAQYEAHVLRRGRQPIKEAAAIEPLLRKLREEMWQGQPELGLWYSMAFRLYADGRLLPHFDYQTRPTISDAPAELEEARADLARAPRPARWVPAWLAV